MSVILMPYGPERADRYVRDLQILARAWCEGVDLGSRKFHIQALVKDLEANLILLRSGLADIQSIEGVNSPDTFVFVESASALVEKIEKIIAVSVPLGS